MIEEKKNLVIVAGADGSGKSTFSNCFKNAFLRSLPVYTLYQGTIAGLSFAAETSLSDQKDIEIIKGASNKGYKITLYYIFSGKLLSLTRARYRSVVEETAFDESLLKREYEASFKGLLEVYQSLDLVFFINNQKEFQFLSAYEPANMAVSAFSKEAKALKESIDRFSD